MLGLSTFLPLRLYTSSVSINIKNTNTAALIRELAERKGVSMTRAVEMAVADQLRKLDDESAASEQEAEKLWAEVQELLQLIREDLSESDREAIREAESSLYDNLGLPR